MTSPSIASASNSYGFKCELSDSDFDQALSHVTDALKAEGFGVLTVIDVQAIMKAKLGLHIRPYRILDASSPSQEHLALDAEPDIGLPLPCNVVVREDPGGRLVVAFMDPLAAMQMTSNLEVANGAQEARARLQRVKSELAHPKTSSSRLS